MENRLGWSNVLDVVSKCQIDPFCDGNMGRRMCAAICVASVRRDLTYTLEKTKQAIRFRDLEKTCRLLLERPKAQSIDRISS